MKSATALLLLEALLLMTSLFPKGFGQASVSQIDIPSYAVETASRSLHRGLGAHRMQGSDGDRAIGMGEFDRSPGRITPTRSVSLSFCRTRLIS
jgi:hypothetical protein